LPRFCPKNITVIPVSSARSTRYGWTPFVEPSSTTITCFLPSAASTVRIDSSTSSGDSLKHGMITAIFSPA
jgi:hypothetical protein